MAPNGYLSQMCGVHEIRQRKSSPLEWRRDGAHRQAGYDSKSKNLWPRLGCSHRGPGRRRRFWDRGLPLAGCPDPNGAGLFAERVAMWSTALFYHRPLFPGRGDSVTRPWHWGGSIWTERLDLDRRGSVNWRSRPDVPAGGSLGAVCQAFWAKGVVIERARSGQRHCSASISIIISTAATCSNRTGRPYWPNEAKCALDCRCYPKG